MPFIDTVYASETEEVEAGSADAGVLASLGINGSLFAFQLINFAIVAVVLWFLILKPLMQKITERQKAIDESLENAKRVQDNLVRSERDYQARIDGAKVEANKIIEKAGVEAQKFSEELKNKAKKEIENLLVQAKTNIRLEKEEVLGEIKTVAAELVTKALEKILSEKINSEQDKKLIERTLKEMK